jgi:hypothetical protein
VTCGLCEEIREFDTWPDQVFKTSQARWMDNPPPFAHSSLRPGAAGDRDGTTRADAWNW